jgi:hypothetical protein
MYIKNLDFAAEVGISQRDLKLTNHLMKVYHLNMIDSTMTISDKWPKD